jgi:hypothetical protein
VSIKGSTLDARPARQEQLDDHGASAGREEASALAAAPWTATGQERPVFLDETGRRRRWVWAAGTLAAVAATAWFGALVTGPLGFDRLPDVPVPIRLTATLTTPTLTLRAPARRVLTVAMVGRRGRNGLVLHGHSGTLHGMLAATTSLARSATPDS